MLASVDSPLDPDVHPKRPYMLLRWQDAGEILAAIYCDCGCEATILERPRVSFTLCPDCRRHFHLPQWVTLTEIEQQDTSDLRWAWIQRTKPRDRVGYRIPDSTDLPPMPTETGSTGPWRPVCQE